MGTGSRWPGMSKPGPDGDGSSLSGDRLALDLGLTCGEPPKNDESREGLARLERLLEVLVGVEGLLRPLPLLRPWVGMAW